MPLNSPTHNGPVGRLYVVATPIGNLEDITLRALKILARADMVLAEDTRHTRQLLSAHNLKKKLIAYHEHNEAQRTPELIEKLMSGAELALVTDAGTPTVSDPGYRLVSAAADKGIAVVPLPGPSAALTALSASGLPTDSFTFAGFPSRKKAQRMDQLRKLAAQPQVVIFYQSPRRLPAFVKEVLEIFGDRPAVVARELTKIHEEFIRGNLAEVLAELEKRDTIKGECTLLVSGAEKGVATGEEIDAAIEAALRQDNISLSQMAKEIAKQLGVKRKTVYDRALVLKKGDPSVK